MKRLIAILFFSVGFFLSAEAARSLREKIQAIPEQEFMAIKLFSSTSNPFQEQYLKQYCTRFDLIRAEKNKLSFLVEKKPQAIKIMLPIYGQWQEVLLVRNEKVADGTHFTTKNEQGEFPYTYNDGVFYHGYLKNESQSVVALSFFKQEVMGILSTPAGNFNIGLSNLWQPSEHEYIVYNEKDALFTLPFHCQSRETPFTKPNKGAIPETLTSKCVKFYVECDNKVYTDFSSNLTNATNYATSLMNNTITLYLNDSIQTAVNQLTIWTSPDPYILASNTGELLDSFAVAMDNGFNGDIAHLMSRRALGGGVAYLDILCINAPYYQTGVSADLSTNVTPVPTYSWNSMVITHEIGHNLASPHTHACAWNGNNTRIDNCAGNFNVAYQEGNCNSFPANPAAGGTIMSYCHLQAVGINLSLGFGPQPATLIRNTINAGTCLGVCDDCASDIIITGNYSTPYTESSTWIKTSGQTRIDSSLVVILDADVNAYILLEAANNNAFVLSAPQINSAYFLAAPIDGCNGVGAKAENTNYADDALLSTNQFSVYPNPTRNTWQVMGIQNNSVLSKVILFSLDGRLLWQSEGILPLQIPALNLHAGLYLLQISQGEVQQSIKLIKE